MRSKLILALFLFTVIARAGETNAFFEQKVAAVLQQHCVNCHSKESKEGELDLSTRESMLAGGEEGAAIAPGQSATSRLIKKIIGAKPKMPKEAPPLTADQIAGLKEWIDQGASWPAGFVIQPKPRNKSGADFWAYQPLKRPAVPVPTDEKMKKWVRTPIDAFIAAKQQEKKLAHSPEADRRTLIRRLYYDLLGLPPVPEEIHAFIQNSSEDAYEKLVDRLLASPRYGERWARHWLDVVHYGETHGYDKDKPRTNAWPYRDYVIRSFNEDKPYARFVQEQVAGDVLFPGTRDGIEALGFIAAGPWDLIGHVEVPESKIDGKIARHLDRDDMITNTIQTFNSMTVQCAQCHNHKFDPITQEDYYSLQAVFSALDRTDVKYDLDPATIQKRSALEQRRTGLETRLRALEADVKARVAAPLKLLNEKVEKLEKPRPGANSKADAYGYHSQIEAKQDVAKWVQVDLKHTTALSTVTLYPCKDDFNNIGEGFGFPVRYKVEVSDNPAFSPATLVGDHTAADLPNPAMRPQSFAVNGQSVRYIRITATKLAPRKNDFIFALSELDALDITGKNVALGAAVTSLDSIEAPPRWKRENLVDGYFPGAGKGDPEELKRLVSERDEMLAQAWRPAERAERDQLQMDIEKTRAETKALPAESVVYAAGIHNGSGAFRGTGPDGGKPRRITLLNRGNVQSPGKEVAPGALSLVTALPNRFELPNESSEGKRRAALANWITDTAHPLTWRSIVNRVWHYHFGRGIVDSPNDFGANGQRPSHPELLDWLAVEFRDNGQSLKKLHRLIVTSATYRQSSTGSDANAQTDIDNRFLWRMNRRRLEAEAIRDSVLAISGKLNPAMYGPSFQDFVIDKPEHSPHYEYHLHNPDDTRSHRRSIYRFIVRSQPQPFMTTLDCADPSIQVDKRNESMSALQALAMLNNSLIVAHSKYFAQKIDQYPGELPDRVSRAFEDVTGRKPLPQELQRLRDYAQAFGMANLCRVLFNLNEFIFVD